MNTWIESQKGHISLCINCIIELQYLNWEPKTTYMINELPFENISVKLLLIAPHYAWKVKIFRCVYYSTTSTIRVGTLNFPEQDVCLLQSLGEQQGVLKVHIVVIGPMH